MYEELVERLKCPRIYNCPVDEQEISCKKCRKTLIDDAVNAIEILEALAQNGQSAIDTNKRLADKIRMLQAELDQLKRERDQAVEDLNTLRKRSGFKCEACYYSDHCSRDVCIGCEYNSDNNWQWRGVQEEKNE